MTTLAGQGARAISLADAQRLFEALAPCGTIITMRLDVGPEGHLLERRRCWRATAWTPSAQREVVCHHAQWDGALVALALALDHERRRHACPAPSPHFE